MKKLLKSDSICQNYAQMKNGPVFMTHGVHPLPTSPSLVDIRFRVRQLSCFTECRRDSDPDFRINPYPHPDICRICPKMLWIKPKIRNRISDRFRLNVWRRRRFELSECSCLLLYTMVEIICCVMFLVVACRTQWDQRPAQGHD